MAYVVTQRSHEIGIRLALNAQRGNATGLVLCQGMKLAGMGIVIGLAGAIGLTRLLRSLLFGFGPTDPLTFTSFSLLLTVVALLACISQQSGRRKLTHWSHYVRSKLRLHQPLQACRLVSSP